MITFLNVLMTVVFLTVVASAIRYGGRYERALAIMLVAASLATKGAQRLLDDYLPLAALLSIDVAVVAGYLWLLWRTRSAWLVAAAGAQALVLGLGVGQALELFPSVWVYFHGVAVLNYVQLGCLAYGVLRHRMGTPPPAPAQADEEASAR